MTGRLMAQGFNRKLLGKKIENYFIRSESEVSRKYKVSLKMFVEGCFATEEQQAAKTKRGYPRTWKERKGIKRQRIVEGSSGQGRKLTG